MSSLPEEIHTDILLRLPVKSTFICKSVCKNWYALISNPNFVKTHHNLTIQKTNFSFIVSKFDDSKLRNVICSVSYDPSSLSSNEFHMYCMEINSPLESLDSDFRFMNSCKGLVCFWDGQKGLFGIWNTNNNEYKEIPDSPNKPDRDIFPYAFGYDYRSGDYKLICLYRNDDDGSLVDVYKMGPNSWKNSTQVIPYEMDITGPEAGLPANGFFHWLSRSFYNLSPRIISLDISNEEFIELQPPPLERGKLMKNVGVLEDCLCVLADDVYVDDINVEVWVMQYYGVQESWSRQYSITREIVNKYCCLQPVWIFSSGEILFASSGPYLIDVILYDPKDGSAREPNMHAENKILTVPGPGNMVIFKS